MAPRLWLGIKDKGILKNCIFNQKALESNQRFDISNVDYCNFTKKGIFMIARAAVKRCEQPYGKLKFSDAVHYMYMTFDQKILKSSVDLCFHNKDVSHKSKMNISRLILYQNIFPRARLA